MPFGGLSLTTGISDNCSIVRVADQRGRGEIFPRTTRMPVYGTILGDSSRLRGGIERSLHHEDAKNRQAFSINAGRVLPGEATTRDDCASVGQGLSLDAGPFP